jgi:hypothetical protein
MSYCHPTTTTTTVDTVPKLTAEVGSPIADPSQYHGLASALQYLTFTRPDIAYVVQQICLHMHDPRDQHLTLVKRVLWYLKAHFTMAYSLLLPLQTGSLPTPMWIGLVALTLVALHPATACSLATT